MKKLAIVMLLAATVVACSKKTETVTTTDSSATSLAAAPGMPAGHPDISAAQQAANPMTAPVGGAQAGTISGTILETMDAAGYTYVKLKTGEGEVWAAVNQTKVEKGKAFTLVPNMVMENFESKSLKRKFDKIIFGSVAGGPGGSNVPAMSGMPTSMPPAMGGVQAPHANMGQPAKDLGPIKVDKAPGGKTVSELWASRASLGGKTVMVRGKVVKFLPGIMGKNWIHLRDGSGTPEKGDNDITITTNDTVAVGDVVTANGLVKIDQDLGAGYKYPVIIEDAKMAK